MTFLEHIGQIANEYAKYLAPDDKEAQTCIYADSIGFLNKVLDEYCLVEKEAVREAFWRLTDKFLNDNDSKSFGAASVVLEQLFPEIAKEVEG